MLRRCSRHRLRVARLVHRTVLPILVVRLVDGKQERVQRRAGGQPVMLPQVRVVLRELGGDLLQLRNVVDRCDIQRSKSVHGLQWKRSVIDAWTNAYLC